MSAKHPYYLNEARDALEKALAAGSGLLAPPVIEDAAAYLVTGVTQNEGFPYNVPCETLNEHVSRLLTWLDIIKNPDSLALSISTVKECIEHLNEYLLQHHE
jgi:predicted nucleic acid-binding protein